MSAIQKEEPSLVVLVFEQLFQDQEEIQLGTRDNKGCGNTKRKKGMVKGFSSPRALNFQKDIHMVDKIIYMYPV